MIKVWTSVDIGILASYRMQAAECMTRGVRLGVRKYLGDDSWKKYFAARIFVVDLSSEMS